MRATLDEVLTAGAYARMIPLAGRFRTGVEQVNMALMSPVTQEADVDRHTETFAAATADLLGLS